MRWVRWRWQLWRAQHWEWKAYVARLQGRGGYGAWERARTHTNQTRLQRPRKRA